jgi:endonuclease III related protein
LNAIADAYETLLRTFGPQGWWPSEGTFETAVGAVLTQGTAWKNAEAALRNLRDARALTPEGLGALGEEAIRRLVAPAGFQTRKASTLRRLALLVGSTTDGWNATLALEKTALRARLLGVRGIGPETADAIVLYAARRPSFVVDTYTRRFASRHSLARREAGYEELQRLFESCLPRDPRLLGEYHALLVELGKRYCRKTPRCCDCPLYGSLPKVD